MLVFNGELNSLCTNKKKTEEEVYALWNQHIDTKLLEHSPA